MDEVIVPPGWKRFEHNGRIVYSTPPFPSPVQIRCHAELAEQHKKGRFLEVEVDQLVFSRKRRKPDLRDVCYPNKYIILL